MFLFLSSLAIANQYSHFATWENPPDIYICGKNTQTIQEVKKSIEYWQNLGYNFGEIKKYQTCQKQIPGAIIIKNEYFENKQGNTYIEKYYYGHEPNKEYIDFVIVRLNNETKLYNNENKESLIHEMGHALGIDHVHNKSDIMYPYTRTNITN